jgi:hypothetical protein
MAVRRFWRLRGEGYALVCGGMLVCVSCATVIGLNNGENKPACRNSCDGAVDSPAQGGGAGPLDASPFDGPHDDESSAPDSMPIGDAAAGDDSQEAGDAADGETAQSDGSLDALSIDAPSEADANAAVEATDRDAGDSAFGSGQGDASDGSFDAAGADAPAVTFTNPLSIDVHALLASNTVVTTAPGGVRLSAMDGSGGHDFPTHAEAIALDPAGIGLPDNAFFPSNGQTIPNVQLAWTNAKNVGNSLVIPSSAGTSQAFDVPMGQYGHLQIYATGANGASTLLVTLTYASGAPPSANSTVTVADWCTPGALPAGQYSFAVSQRVKGQMLDSARCNIYAIDLNPDPARFLSRVAFVALGSAMAYVTFYGATAW